KRTPDKKIYAVAYLSVLAGTRWKTVWNPVEIVQEDEFSKQHEYYQWSWLECDVLPDGMYSVDYYLNDIRWASIHFEVHS
ncbi:unnamed protein product, partial [marine sediment metagenome]